MIVRYRMASVFYIKVKGLTRKGDFGDLLAESTPDGIVVTPTLRNEGNSMVRPVGSLKVVDADGKVVADMPDIDMLPVLGGAETSQPVHLKRQLAAGTYTIKYRVDFGHGRNPTEGVTDLVVRPRVQIAATETSTRKP
jgi:hypothetical protein